MKLTVFQSADGDCLLVTGKKDQSGKDGKTLLVDGGRSGSYVNHAAPYLSTLPALDLVCVSHIDSDHISGILQLFDDLFAWKVYDYQQAERNRGFERPANPRPPQVLGVWHNAFKDQVGENEKPIQDQLVANARVLNMDDAVIGEQATQQSALATSWATSVNESLQLVNRLSPKQLRIPVNKKFKGKAIFLDEKPISYRLGTMQLRLLGPFKVDLEKQRKDWNTWLERNKNVVDNLKDEAAEDAAKLPLSEGDMVLSYMRSLANALGERNLVTPPNLASIMLLVQEGGQSLLLTGDGHSDDISRGLKFYQAALKKDGLMDSQGRVHVDVLKVQHHGAEFNITPDFCKTVTADHYVFCGDGAHHNPDLKALKTLIDARQALQEGRAAGRPYKLWFTASANNAATESRRAHMAKVEALVKAEAEKSGGCITYHFEEENSFFTLLDA